MKKFHLFHAQEAPFVKLLGGAFSRQPIKRFQQYFSIVCVFHLLWYLVSIVLCLSEIFHLVLRLSHQGSLESDESDCANNEL